MITLTPSPRITDIIKCIFSRKKLNNNCLKYWVNFRDEKVFLFARTVWSLQAIILWYIKFYRLKNKVPVIWVPDYFCNQTILEIKNLGCIIEYYPIDVNFHPKRDSCESLARSSSPDVFVLVHYFGVMTRASWIKTFCKNHYALLVEDAAHVLLANNDIGRVGDFVLYSLHKHLSIPDGAICIMRDKNIKLSNNTDPCKVMEDVIATMGYEAPSPVKWLVKRIVQKLLNILGLSNMVVYFKRYQAQDFYDDGVLVRYNKTPQMSNFSKKMLACVSSDLQKIAAIKKNNLLIWQFVITNFFKGCSMSHFPNGNTVPYLAVVQCNDVRQADNIYQSFVQLGFSPQTWPDLPPEVKLSFVEHQYAITLRNTLLFLPIHQTLSLLKIVIPFLSQYALRVSAQSSNLVMHEISMKTWGHLFAKIEDVNFLQSSQYVVAKAVVEGWKIKRYCIKEHGRCLAIFQILEKTFGPIVMMRINQGPLWQAQTLDLDLKIKVLAKIKTLVKGIVPRFLFIAPWMQESLENSMVLVALGYRRRAKKSCWESIRLDLSKTKDAIKKDFLSRWRYDLNRSMQCDLRCVMENSDEALDVLLNDYIEFQKNKGFRGIDCNILKESVKSYSINTQFLVIMIYYNNQKVSSALVAISEQVATYLIGVNSDIGRSIGANSFLLWQVILKLKYLRCRWFDLGGIDEKNTPGISRFKKGLGGSPYKLQGEYLTW